MSTTAERIAVLEDALSSGHLSVEFDGRRVTYKSVTDLRSAIDYFREKERGEQRKPAVGVSVGGHWRA